MTGDSGDTGDGKNEVLGGAFSILTDRSSVPQSKNNGLLLGCFMHVTNVRIKRSGP